MIEVTVTLEPAVALFYGRLAEAVGKTLEQVLSDALFKLAGELSMEALRHQDFAAGIRWLPVPDPWCGKRRGLCRLYKCRGWISWKYLRIYFFRLSV